MSRRPMRLDVNKPCWEWPAGRNSRGYGWRHPGPDGGTFLAHRWVYQQLIGPIPDGLDLDHLCGNPACVNPAHLEPVTHAENVRRGYWGQITHCLNGHEFTPENTFSTPKNARGCRECRKNRARKWRADQKEKNR